MIPATLAYSVYSIPHFFQPTHLDGISTPEAIGLTTANALGALLGLTTIVHSWCDAIAPTEAERRRDRLVFKGAVTQRKEPT